MEPELFANQVLEDLEAKGTSVIYHSGFGRPGSKGDMEPVLFANQVLEYLKAKGTIKIAINPPSQRDTHCNQFLWCKINPVVLDKKPF